MESFASFAFTYRGALVTVAATAAFAFPGTGAGPGSRVAALAFLAGGVALRIAGVRSLGGRARVHTAGARALATEGIFSQVRNPIYLGNVAFAVGFVSAVASWRAAVLVAAYLITLYSVISRHEEGVLLQRFGLPYRDYRSRVPRWIWRPRTWSVTSTPLTAWREVWRLEHRFVICGVVFALIGILPISGSLPDDTPLWNLLGAGVVLLVSAALFVRVARRVRHKRRDRSLVDPSPEALASPLSP